MAVATHALSKWSFSAPNDVRTFEKQRLELLDIGDNHIGHSVTQPGWRWSTHVGSVTGQKLCGVRHTLYIISGRTHVAMEDGSEMEFGPGDVAFIPPGHDAWVMGDEPNEMIDFGGDLGSFGKR